ncbi:MAG TPA: cupin domain-containing protein [Candidatus Woesebacteria bacterium]|nr:cupin domain-containing protein [Candidatus Woesebacteria bacterium]HNS65512.1 cupin domain-containing protein [Candidatus Woesebacteria bacterium]
MTGYIGKIEQLTLNNTAFRQVVFTGKHAQLVVMSLLPREEIGEEVHNAVDQFFRVESGTAKVVMNGEESVVSNGDAFVVPAGTVHNVINVSTDQPLKLYTIYSPPNHPEGTVHQTKAEAEAAHESEHAV